MHIPGEEIEKNVSELGKNIAEDLLRPTSKSVGDNIGLFVDGVMGWLGYLGEKQRIKRELYIANYKSKIIEKIEKIPGDRLEEPKLRIVGPAIEASKYFIEEEECRDMFANLIASSCDSSFNNKVHPGFIDIIKQLTPLDARFISMFKSESTFPAVHVRRKNEDGSITPFPFLFVDCKQYNFTYTTQDVLEITKSIDNLKRFGLVVLNQDIIELGYDYDSFKSQEIIHALIDGLGEEGFFFKKYRLELSELGKDFIDTCIR